jgi:hypothetical protein
MANRAKNAKGRQRPKLTDEDIRSEILSCYAENREILITGPDKDGNLYFRYRRVWKALLREVAAAQGEDALERLVEFGLGTALSTPMRRSA